MTLKTTERGEELTLMAYNFSSLRSHLWANLTTLITPFPIASFCRTPYFSVKPTTLSPDVLLARPSPVSEFDFFDDDGWELFLRSLGPLARRSLRLNLWPPSALSEWTKPGFCEGVTKGASLSLLARLSCDTGTKTGDHGARILPETPADMLGAWLAGWLGSLLGPLLDAPSQELSVGDVAHGEGEWIGLCSAEKCFLRFCWSKDDDEVLESETAASVCNAPRMSPGSFWTWEGFEYRASCWGGHVGGNEPSGGTREGNSFPWKMYKIRTEEDMSYCISMYPFRRCYFSHLCHLRIWLWQVHISIHITKMQPHPKCAQNAPKKTKKKKHVVGTAIDTKKNLDIPKGVYCAFRI